MISPVLTRLKELGYYIVLNTNKRGLDLYQDDPRIDRFIKHEEDMPIDALYEHWDKLKEEEKPDFYCNFTSSIENNVALHPTQPLYTAPKWERASECDRNYYDATEEHAKISGCGKLPSLYFTEAEEKEARKYIRKNKFNILWALSGSGRNKVYPWTEFVMGSLIKEYGDKIHIITVGDNKCQILENIHNQLPKDNFTELAGKIPMKIAMCLTKYADLVISPDTGILHSSGCFKTPKIGLLGHTTINNITKYFENDYSIEAKCGCAPCFYLIYDHNIQCPIESVTHAAWCMSEGLKPERLFNRIKEVYDKFK